MNLNGRNMVFTVLVYKEDDLARKYAQIKLTELAASQQAAFKKGRTRKGNGRLAFFFPSAFEKARQN